MPISARERLRLGWFQRNEEGATSGEVRLGCTLAEFDELAPAETTEFLPGGHQDTG